MQVLAIKSQNASARRHCYFYKALERYGGMWHWVTARRTASGQPWVARQDIALQMLELEALMPVVIQIATVLPFIKD